MSEMTVITDSDQNVNPDVDMDLLVDEQADPENDYLEAVNKEPEEQDPDPDKVVEADLAMDPAAAATESYNGYSMDVNYPRSVENHKHRTSIGISDYYKDLVAIKVVDRKFTDTTYNSFENFSISEAGEYATESLSQKFTETFKPASLRDYENNKIAYQNILNKTLVNFIKKTLNSNVASMCSYTVNDPKIYGTTSVNVRFKNSKGEKLPLGAVYGLEWYNGKPAVSAIVPLMKIDQSVEKFLGYIKQKELKRFIENEGKKPKGFSELMRTSLVKEKVKLLKQDIERRGFKPCTVDEAKNNKYSFGAKWFRYVDPKNQRHSIVRFEQMYGIVFAYWSVIKSNVVSQIAQRIKKEDELSVVALVKNRDNKIKSIGFIIGLNIGLGVADIKTSRESYHEFNLDDALSF